MFAQFFLTILFEITLYTLYQELERCLAIYRFESYHLYMPDWFFIFKVTEYFLNPQDQINNYGVGIESIIRSVCTNIPQKDPTINLQHAVISFCIACLLLYCIFFEYLVNNTNNTNTFYTKVSIPYHQFFKNITLQNSLTLFLLMISLVWYLYLYTSTTVVVDYTVNIHEVVAALTRQNNPFESLTTNNHNNFLLDYNNLFFDIFYWQYSMGWFYTSETINLSFLHDIY